LHHDVPAQATPSSAQARRLGSLDLEQPDERRLVLLIERHNGDDAEVLVAAGDDSSPGWIIVA
jgi:hypothetical protein